MAQFLLNDLARDVSEGKWFPALDDLRLNLQRIEPMAQTIHNPDHIDERSAFNLSKDCPNKCTRGHINAMRFKGARESVKMTYFLSNHH